MADTNKYIGGIVIQAEGFEVGANAPVDSRFRVKNAQGLNELKTYEGLISYNEADKKYYQFVDGAWKALSVNSATELEGIIKNLIATETTGAMEFKGATAALPENPGKGDMWKVAGENINITIDEKAAKVGDTIIYNGEAWVLIPSGDDIEDTWRKVIAGGKELANDEALELVAGENVTITEEGGKVTISSSYEDTHYESKLVVGNEATDSADENVVENNNVHLNLVEDGVVKSSHKIVGAGGITVTHATGEEGNVITIEAPEGAKYDLSAKTENGEAILSLAGTDNTEDKVAVVGDDAVSVSVADGKIKVSAHDTKYTGSEGNGIKVTVVDDGAISAEIEANAVTTEKIADKNVTLAKLADEVVNAINKDDNTEYGFAAKAGSDLTFTVTPSEGEAYDVTLEAGALAVKDKVAKTDLDEALALELDGKQAAGDYATNEALNVVDAKFEQYKTAEAQKAIDDEQDRRLGVIESTYATTEALNNVDAKFTQYNTKEAQKVIDDEQDRRLGVIEGDHVTRNEFAEVKATAEAATTVEEVDDQIDAKIAALKLGETYEAIGAEERAKAYADGLITNANLGQYTTEQEVKDLVDEVIAGAVDGDTITGLANLVEYLNTHGAEAKEMSAAIDVLEGKVDGLEKAPAAGILATDIEAWNGEIGAKAAAEAAQKTIDDYATAHASDYTNKQIDDAIDADVKTAIDAEIERADAKYELDGAEERAIAAAKTETENQIAALDLANTYQAKGDYASAEQGAKADTALQEITTTEGHGLKVTNKNNIDIDTDVVFVLDCNW